MKHWGATDGNPGNGDVLALGSVLEREEITPEISHQESFLLGLRTVYGVNPDEMSEHRGGDPWGNGRKRVILRLLDEGRLEADKNRIMIPKRHWLFADGIIRKLL
jgi:coproporphyrinogen III oxidase-like Fe-S oxidoreductase